VPKPGSHDERRYYVVLETLKCLLIFNVGFLDHYDDDAGARIKFGMGCRRRSCDADVVCGAARPGARARCALPGARDERVHRPDDPAMRTTGTPVGRGGQPQRLDQGIVLQGGR
jgi:hypothetical protein